MDAHRSPFSIAPSCILHPALSVAPCCKFYSEFGVFLCCRRGKVRRSQWHSLAPKMRSLGALQTPGTRTPRRVWQQAKGQDAGGQAHQVRQGQAASHRPTLFRPEELDGGVQGPGSSIDMQQKRTTCRPEPESGLLNVRGSERLAMQQQLKVGGVGAHAHFHSELNQQGSISCVNTLPHSQHRPTDP